ncbi:enoyl-CoA hydratase-related protein [Acuticoccus sp. I52.16.1]|uniref:enoyl-CoA hydratase-related protein n=1 Tax=Acuticoccus sp. I52.16.1 TaxID=2928472 RepID=UPI001FD0CF8E|nr:enoyl-CoA hydratase-related protein [Acuticoccus sp. I52.16.1]UOM34739.1 enoyl-CoA hydratase-related protein [Acuticoccus sp. I52.16.1]
MAEATSGDAVLIEQQGDVTVLRLNDPKTMNAVTEEVGQTLRRALEAAGQSSRAVVLAGGERAFSSGAKLSADSGMVERGGDIGASLERTFNPLMRAIRDLPIPVVTAVRGAAAGVGASLAMAGDIIVAGRSAYFLEAFARIGLVPDGGATWMLTRAVGRVRAMEMMLLAEKIPAETAHQWGLVTRVVEDDTVDEVAVALATRLAAGPSTALGLIRRAAWAACETTFDEALARERANQREAGHHPDFAEGLAAFQAKRAAKFGA